ncbi:MAG: DUF4355 domain-containing protein [Hespellia sp.]|nr:DUF4355 domain-containing protein [Hespellia sp.]
MKYKNLKQFRIPMAMNLQLFAEGDGAGAGDGGNGGGVGGKGAAGSGQAGAGDGGDGGEEPKTFDDILSDSKYQAEFDRRVNKAVETAVENAHTKWKALTDDKLTEAEKLAKMTKEEKAVYKAQKLEREIADLKRQNAMTEMSKTARKMLSDEEINIPDELLGHLVAEDAEGTKAAVEAFAKLFKGAVQSAVKDALKGNPPKSGTGGKALTKEQILAIKNPSERQKLIAENMTLFQ